MRVDQAFGRDNTDAAVARADVADEPEPVEVYGDCAYGTGDLTRAIGAGQNTLGDQTAAAAARRARRVHRDDFTVNIPTRTPTPTRRHRSPAPHKRTRTVTSKGTVNFGYRLPRLFHYGHNAPSKKTGRT